MLIGPSISPPCSTQRRQGRPCWSLTCPLDRAQRNLHIHPTGPCTLLHGPPTTALKSLDSTLSLPAARLLSSAERAKALLESAKLKLAMNQQQRIDSTVKDLVMVVELSEEERVNSDTLCLLGKCYEWKGMKEEARKHSRRLLMLSLINALCWFIYITYK